jgi:hypothetical protein
MKTIMVRAAGVIFAVAALLGAISATAAQASSSAAVCQARVSAPNISLHTDPQYQGYSMTQTCGATSADWEIVSASRYDHGGLIWPGGMYTDYYADSFDVGGHLGLYVMEPQGAYDANFNAVPQATEYFYIRSASRGAMTGTRSGHWVYLRGYAARYSPDVNYGSGGYVASGSRKVTFEYWRLGAWHVITSAYTGSAGHTALIRSWQPYRRSFRAVVAVALLRWGCVSGSIYR